MSLSLSNIINYFWGGGEQQKIVAPAGQNYYLGAHVNHYTDEEHLACFDLSSGGQLDISQRFINFADLRFEDPFPTAEAERMRHRGGALYLVLEPGRSGNPFGQTAALEMILRGGYDDELKIFAQQCHSFGGPVFLSFRPALNAQLDPEQLKAAYVYIQRRLFANGADNVTWVWPVNLADSDYLQHAPDQKLVDWTAVTVYRPEEMARLKANLTELQKLGKPIILELGSDALPADKTSIITALFNELPSLGVKAVIIKNVSQVEAAQFRGWSISSADAKAALRAAVAAHERLLRDHILTRGGPLSGSPAKPEPTLDCSAIEQTYYDLGKAQAIARIKKTIAEDEKYLSSLGPFQQGDAHYNNKKRVELAAAYQQLAYLTGENKYFVKAKQHLDTALNTPDPVLIYHWEKKYIREYFEVMLKTADLSLSSEPGKTLDYCRRITSDLDALNAVRFFNPLQGRKESIPGYYHKALYLQAQALELQGKLSEAGRLYDQIVRWSENEVKKTIWASLPFIWDSLWWRGETADGVRYDGALAKIKSGFVNLHTGDRVNLERAITQFNSVLSWSKVSELDNGPKVVNFINGRLGNKKQEAFLDLAIASLVGVMLAYALADPKTAKDRFSQELPWATLYGRHGHELMKALGYANKNLADTGGNQWENILNGLANLDLPPQIEVEYSILLKVMDATTGSSLPVTNPIASPAESAGPALITWPPTFATDLNGPEPASWQTANWSNGNPFNATWQGEQISFNNGLMSLTLDNVGCPAACDGRPYASGEYRSTQETFGYGYYETRLRAAAGDGLVTSFFTYTGTYGKSDHDEIDIEILGKNTTQAQLNYYVAGQGNHEKIIDLGFDAAAGFHNYGFYWTVNELTWYVDGKPVHTVRGAMPSRPGKIMVNLWPGIGVDGWLGPFNYPGRPLTTQYDWIRYAALESQQP